MGLVEGVAAFCVLVVVIVTDDNAVEVSMVDVLLLDSASEVLSAVGDVETVSDVVEGAAVDADSVAAAPVKVDDIGSVEVDAGDSLVSAEADNDASGSTDALDEVEAADEVGPTLLVSPADVLEALASDAEASLTSTKGVGSPTLAVDPASSVSVGTALLAPRMVALLTASTSSSMTMRSSCPST